MYSIYTIFIFLIFIFLLVKMFYSDAVSNSSPFPIDVVYTWKGEEVTDNTRSSYNHELKYSLRSIDLYAPWVNKIYILTDYPKKYPSWINPNNNKIIMIDTTETFPSDRYLPNSNSNAIESTIVNIKGLSEHYIYFCDDIFLGRKTTYTDFFTPDGKAKVDKYTMESNDILKNKQYNILEIDYPLSVNRMYKHVPIPQIKSIVLEFNERYSDYLEWIRMTKTRNKRGFDVCETYGLNTPCQQIHYPICKYMHAKQKVVFVDYDDSQNATFLKNNNPNLRASLNILYESRPLFFCINDDETDILKRENARNAVLNFFTIYFTQKPRFEI